MRRILVFLLATLISTACVSATDPTETAAHREREMTLSRSVEASARAHLDLRVERASLIASAEALSDAIESDGVVAALGGALAGDVFFLSPRMPIIQGAGSAQSFLATNPLAPSALRWDVLKADVSSDGTHGYTWAEGFLTIDLGAGPAERPWIFLIAWRRNSAGTWQISAFVFNLRQPEHQSIPAGFGTPTSKHRRNFPHTDVAEQKAELLRVDADFAALSVQAGTGVAFRQFAAPEAIAVANGALVFGPAAIGQAYTFPPGDVLSWTPLYADVAASGDLGFTVGHGTYYAAQIGQSFYSKYLTIWQKQNTGEWLYVGDLGNSRPAP